MSQPLPSQLPESLNRSDVVSEIRSAYSKILLLEQAATADTNHNGREQRLVHARILGYLILEGPSIRASEYVAKEVNSCQDYDQMDKIGEIYHLHFIRACESPSLCCFSLSDSLLIVKRQKGATPAPSSHPSRPSFDTKKEMMKDMLRQGGEPPQHHAQAKKNVSCVCALHATNLLIQKQSPRLSSGMIFGASFLANMILRLR